MIAQDHYITAETPDVVTIEAEYLKDAARAHKRMVLATFCGHYGCWNLSSGPDGFCGSHYMQYCLLRPGRYSVRRSESS